MSAHLSSHLCLRSVLICIAASLLPFSAQAIEPSQSVEVTALKLQKSH
jgi:hypothetical protein